MGVHMVESTVVIIMVFGVFALWLVRAAIHDAGQKIADEIEALREAIEQRDYDPPAM